MNAESFQRTVEQIREEIATLYPLFDLEIPMEPTEAVYDAVKVVLAKFLPSWQTDDFRMRQYTDGITNKLFKVVLEGKNNTALVRVYGRNTELLIDREQEIMTILSLHRAGMASALYGRFTNGMCYGFVPGRAISFDEMKEREKARLIARRLAKLHKTPVVVKSSKQPSLFVTLRNWIKQLEDIQQQQQQSGSEEQDEISIFQREIDGLEDVIQTLDSPVSFCHNDLLCGNILFDDGAAMNQPASIRFIDFEYGSYNYSAYDIANHFCEMMGYHVDPKEYPSAEFQRWWLEEYVLASSTVQLGHSAELPKIDVQRAEESAQQQVDHLFAIVNKFAVVAHFFWSLWALIQASNSSNSDFDYRDYSRKKYRCFLDAKASFF